MYMYNGVLNVKSMCEENLCALCKHCDMTWNEPCTCSTVQSNYNKQIKTSVEIIIFISLVREICYSSFHGCTHVPMK